MTKKNDPYVRGINKVFIESLHSGKLSGFLDLAKSNPDVCLEIRKHYINLYYRGGNAVKISHDRRVNTYTCKFDEKYCQNKNDESMLDFIRNMNNKDPDEFLKNFDVIKHEMDTWLDLHKNAERDFQHNLIKRNHNKFRIIDIEYAGRTSLGNKFRIDMIGINMDTEGNKLVLVENKYGDKISGSSGVLKHLNDMLAIINDEVTFTQLIQSVNNIILNKKDLDLLDFTLDGKFEKSDVEILFVLGNYSRDVDYVRRQIRETLSPLPIKVLIQTPDQAKKPFFIDYSNAEKL